MGASGLVDCLFLVWVKRDVSSTSCIGTLGVPSVTLDWRMFISMYGMCGETLTCVSADRGDLREGGPSAKMKSREVSGTYGRFSGVSGFADRFSMVI